MNSSHHASTEARTPQPGRDGHQRADAKGCEALLPAALPMASPSLGLSRPFSRRGAAAASIVIRRADGDLVGIRRSSRAGLSARRESRCDGATAAVSEGLDEKGAEKRH